QSETAVIEKTFQMRGFQIVDFRHPADVAVINTCTVTENGDADTRRLVNKVIKVNPRVKIALIGCQAQIQKESLASLPNIRWIVGNARKMELADILESAQQSTQVEVITPSIPRESFTIPTAGIDLRHTRANIKIQDGCDFFCSFCEIPYARGRARSREFEDILREVRTLVEAGHQEIVLTGINIGTYRYKKYSLLDVIDRMEEIEGLQRIRISSIEPTTIAAALIDKIKSSNKLCRYLHIPLQSGSDEVLQSMKRKYTIKEYSDFVRMVKSAIPDLCIGTDVIVGFPAESEENFQESMNILRELPIDYFHVFSYSQRHLAQSRTHSNAIAPALIQKRSQLLRELSQRKRHLFMETQLETTQMVLFEQCKDGYWNGLTDHYIRIHVKTAESLTNQFRLVRLREVQGQAVIGELVDAD
ncbi:MAG: tRNA (N(6)-L-threonylcarbamoyladenosine(37)-C(2))-methylthiotransferase MtaB, partial [Candidatus Omnitrophica bacterium]|nr:tRNA (N(6)-L-threonylcarbamoyladenosine(37)-C(2))-methylthiotransferase MtaB [Candidatus Omnitrophota bacterium]